jgi:geranylgeranyl pyrophosphate synthase
MKFNFFPNSFRNELERILNTEKEYVNKDANTLNSINILLSAFEDKNDFTELMKCLKGFEAQTLIIDKFLDNPKTKDKEMRVIAGIILYATMTEQFSKVLDTYKITPKKKLALLDKWNYSLKHVYIGQGLDVHYTKIKIKPISLDEYLLMIKETTAILMQLPLYIGCSINNLTKTETNKLMKYGLNLGLAFQIKDDFEDFENDVYEGKQRAFIVKEHLDKLSKKDKEYILRNYRKKPNECIKIIKKSEISKEVQKLNNFYVNLALLSLKGLKGKHIIKLKAIANLCKV